MTSKTYTAVAELVQAAAHYHGLTGPVPFTVCRARDYSVLPSNQMQIEDYEAELTVIPPTVPGAKFEAKCHLCTWSFHKWTDAEARACLRTHIIDEHLTPPGSNPSHPHDRRLPIWPPGISR